MVLLLIKRSKVLSQTILVYIMKMCHKFTRMWAKYVENYRVFTGNIGKGCLRSQEVNNKITPCYRVKSCGNNLIKFEGFRWWEGEGDFRLREQQMYTIMIDL